MRFQQDSQRVGLHGITLDQRCDDSTLMSDHAEQGLCF